MFRHQGKKRTLSHNKKIASLLSFVAGIVNVAGFLSVQRLTTNVTGHFAFFVDEVFKLNFTNAFHVALFVIFFFLGAFFANFMVETYSRIRESETYIFPIKPLNILFKFTVSFFGSSTSFARFGNSEIALFSSQLFVYNL